MIGGASAGGSFSGLSSYLERDKKDREHLERVEWIEQRNLIYAENLQQAAREMDLVARGNERVEKPVYHLSISWSRDEQPTKEQMVAVADRTLKDLKLSEHQAVIVAHADEPYAHVHIMVNRVHPETGKVWSNSHDWRRIEASLRQQERDFGFKETPGHLHQLDGQQAPDRSASLSKGAYKAAVREGKIPFQQLVREVAREDFQRATDWEDLTERLARNGLRLEARHRGLVVTDGHEYAKSSSIDQDASRGQLEQRFCQRYQDYVEGRAQGGYERTREPTRGMSGLSQSSDDAENTVRRHAPGRAWDDVDALHREFQAYQRSLELKRERAKLLDDDERIQRALRGEMTPKQRHLLERDQKSIQLKLKVMPQRLDLTGQEQRLAKAFTRLRAAGMGAQMQRVLGKGGTQALAKLAASLMKHSFGQRGQGFER